MHHYLKDIILLTTLVAATVIDDIDFCTNPQQDAPCNHGATRPCCVNSTFLATCTTNFLSGSTWDIENCAPGACQVFPNRDPGCFEGSLALH